MGLASRDKNLSSMNTELELYIESEILPRYENMDRAHSIVHVRQVIEEGLAMARQFGADCDMVYTAAAYHDLGAAVDRATHHVISARMIREDGNLRRFFSQEQIGIIADAAEDHRASSGQPPRTLYGRIIADADHRIHPETIMKRCVEYGLDHYPELDPEGHFERFCRHLEEKYGRNGYMRLWLEGTESSERLEELRQVIDSRSRLRKAFDGIYPILAEK